VVAFVSGLLCPGLGWAYLGRPFLGLVINAAIVTVVGAFLVLWARTRFNPVVPLLALVLGLLGLTVMMASDMAVWAARHGQTYVVRDTNHPLVYALVVLLGYVLPLGGLGAFATSSLFFVAHVQDAQMLPTLVPGDRVLVDRLAYVHRGPALGDVVVYRSPGSEEQAFGRVLGASGESVVVQRGLPAVGAHSCTQSRLDESSHQQLSRMAARWESGREPVLESCLGVVWPVLMPTTVEWGEADVSDAADGVFVLSDDRSSRNDSRTHGRVDLDRVEGRVTWVGWSRTDGAEGAGAELGALWSGLTATEDVGGADARFGRRTQPVARGGR
jgi:signal peptidase I